MLSAILVLAAGCGSDDDPEPGTDAGTRDVSGSDTGAAEAGGDVAIDTFRDVAAPDAPGSDTIMADAALDAAPGATVQGTVTLPGIAVGKPWEVRVYKQAGVAEAPLFGHATGTTTDSLTLDYLIPYVPVGSYFILAFVDVDVSGGTSSTPGDYAGWYGHTGDGNPPDLGIPNAVVPASGVVRFDFNLVMR